MDRKTVFSAFAVLGGSALLYTIYWRQSLSRRIAHTSKVGRFETGNKQDQLDVDNSIIVNLTNGFLGDVSQYHVIDDIAFKSVPIARLPDKSLDSNLLLTTYLRYTMTRFSRFPQAWIMKLLYRSDEKATKTFDSAYIQSLNFVPDNLVNGGYRVERRNPSHVVFEMVLPARSPPISGKLIVGMLQRHDEMLVYSRTLQWRKKIDEHIVLPLERPPIRWLHEIASWWLIDTGTAYLCNLKSLS